MTRAIKAAEQAGLRIAGVRADGTVITYKEGESPLLPVEAAKPGLSKYEDVG
jgi:hypothetical protein